jgi:predicted transcriptional regulator
MTTLNISLSEELLLRLQELARKAGIAPEELLRESVERWLAVKPPEDFERAAAYVFRKNAEIYRRFA